MNTGHPARRSRPRSARAALLPPLLGVVLLSTIPAAADMGFVLHAEGATAHAVGNLKGEQYGWGGAGLVGLELSLGRVLGVEVPVGIVGLSAAPAPSPAYMATSAATAFFTTPGLRLRPLAWLESPWARSFWLAGGAGVSITGARPFPTVSARAGFDVPLGRVSFGPYAGLVQIIDPGQTLAVDARIVTGGLHGTLDLWSRSPRRSAPPPPEPKLAAAALPPAVAPDEDGVAVAEDTPAAVAETPAPPRVAARTPVEHRPRFASGAATLLPSAAVAIERVLALIAARSYDTVVVSGHADDVGSDDYNLALSEQRARAVVEALVRRGVDRARIRVVAFGATRPLRSERTPDARRENRRVEIEIVWPVPAREER